MIDIEELNDIDRKKILDFISKKDLFEFIKKHSKYYSKDLIGIRIDKKSKVLQQRLPEIIIKKIEQKDIVTLKFISTNLRMQIEEINQYIKLRISNEKLVDNIIVNKELLQGNSSSIFILYINSIISTKDRKLYMRLIEFILELVKAEDIMLYFTLNKIELKPRQKKLMKMCIEESKQILEIKRTILKEEKEKIEEQIKLIKKEGQELLANEKITNKDLLLKLQNKDIIINNEKQKYYELANNLEKQRNNNELLRKDLKELEDKIKNINENLKDKKNSFLMELQKKKDINKELEKEIENKNIVINQLNKQLNERYEVYAKNYELKWKKSNQVLLNEESNIKKKIEELNINIEILKDRIVELELQKEEKIEKLTEYNKIVSNFINNIDKELITSAIKSSMLNVSRNEKESNNNSTKVYVKDHIKGDFDEIEIIEDIEQFSDLISDNFKNLGMEKKSRDSLSDYIVSVLAAKIIPIIYGCKTREIAKAISCAYSGETPLIITLPAGYNNATELIDIYKKSESKVILIEGIVGNMNESVILPLVKEYSETEDSDKIILISCEDTRMVDLLPSYIFEYFALIEIKDIRPVKNYKYLYGNSLLALKTFKEDDLEIELNYLKLKKMFKNIDFSKAYVFSRTLILSYLENILQDKALACLIIFDIKITLKDDSLIEKISENIHMYSSDFDIQLENLL